jgi:hypothetical protein
MVRVRTEEYKEKQRIYNKKYHQEHKEERLKTINQWKENNPEKTKQYVNNYRERHPIDYILRRAKMRARQLDLDFNLEKEDIIVPMICPYLKVPLKFEMGKGYQDTNISLDRINNSKGYIKGNVEVISTLANKMKANADWKQLEIFATEVLRRVGER